MTVSLTTRLGIHRWSADSDEWDRAEWDADNAALEELTVIGTQGPANARPAAGVQRRLYIATDTERVSIDTGSAWVDLSRRVGQIILWPFAAIPADCLVLDGSTFSATTYPILAALNGGTTLPDWRGRVPVARDTGQVEFDTIGETGGEKAHTLTVTELASHDHAYTGTPDIEGLMTTAYGANVDSARTVGLANKATGTRGGGAAHNNLQPYKVATFLIQAR